MRQGPQHSAGIALVVMGVSGSGKSTLGKSLAHALGGSFLEGDSFHSPENVAKMRAGTPLDDDDRWPWLDQLGRALGKASAEKGGAVAACSALKRAYRERLSVAAGVPLRFILLDLDRDQLARRLARRSQHYMPASLLDSQLATLERPGPDEDVLVLDGATALGTLRQHALDWALAATVEPTAG